MADTMTFKTRTEDDGTMGMALIVSSTDDVSYYGVTYKPGQEDQARDQLLRMHNGS